MIISLNYEPLPGFCGKRFLTTYLTITGFGTHGGSGDERFKEQLFRSEACQVERKGFKVSSHIHLGPRDREFESRSPDQNRKLKITLSSPTGQELLAHAATTLCPNLKQIECL